MDIFEQFIDYLIEQNMIIEKENLFETEDLYKLEIHQDVAGENISFQVIFDKVGTFVDILVEGIIGYAQEDIVDVLILANTLNMQYRGIQFYIDKQSLNSKASILIEEQFIPEGVMMRLLLLKEIVENIRSSQV